MSMYEELIKDSDHDTDTEKVKSRHAKHGGPRPRIKRTAEAAATEQQSNSTPLLRSDTDVVAQTIKQNDESVLRIDSDDQKGHEPLFRMGGDNQEDYRNSVRDVINNGSKDSSAFNDSTDGFQQPSQASAYAERLLNKDTTGKKSLIRTTAGVLGREVEKSFENGEDDITDRASGYASKYMYRAGSHGAKGAIRITRSVYRNVRYKKKLSNDLKSGALTEKEAKKAFRSRRNQNTKGALSFLGKAIKDDTVKSIEDFNGSDDFATQAVTKPKDTVVRARRSIKVVRSAGYTAKKGIKRTKAIYTGAKNILSKLILVKGAGIFVIVAVVIVAMFTVILAVSSLFPVLSLKSEDADLSDTYLYITQLDAKLEEDIYKEDQKIHVPPIGKYVYFLNNREVPKNQIKILTDADSLLNYFDSKYEDFSFNRIKREIKDIHASLYSVSKVEKLEVDDGVITRFLYIKVTAQTWEEYYNANKGDLLTRDQQDEYETLKGIGIYTFRQELSSPFLGQNWHSVISSRWGWRLHPITGNLAKHAGVDIAMPGGTPINACNSGTAKVMYNEDGYGKYVEIVMKNGDYTLYAHMRSVAVTNGQQVTTGDVIGYVGTTGASTGNHLHFEYHKNNQNMCPVIFTECEDQGG